MKQIKSHVKNCVTKLMKNKTSVAALTLIVPIMARACVLWILGAEDAPECMIEK